MDWSFVRKAAKVADAAHRNQFYGEFYYIYHLEGVKNLAEIRNTLPEHSTTVLAAAYLHDILEDTDTLLTELVKEFGWETAHVVSLLTKNPGQTYEDYMRGVLSSPIATEVKKCDTMFNLGSSFKEGNQKRIAKYIKQLDILERGYV